MQVEQEYALLPGITVSNVLKGFELEPHWVEWLGTLQAESFKKSTLFITAVRTQPNVVWSGPAHEFLDRRVRLLHHALVLLGCGYNNGVLMVGGNTAGGGLHIGPVRSGLTPCFRSYYRKYRKIELQDLDRSATILTNLEHIFGHAPNPVFKRLRKGFKVWIRGAEEPEEYSERVHSYVRATEAILKPTLARKRTKAEMKRAKRDRREYRPITTTFISRGQTLIGHSKASGDLLRQLYEIRSSVEHTKDILPQVKAVEGILKKEAFEFRALQCEILAGEVFARILSTPHLLEAFSTERKVEGFWSRTIKKRSELWGEAIDLDADARKHFFSHFLPESY
jgi:hypothetical protein